MSVTPDKQFVQLPVDTARWRRLFGLNGPFSLVLLPLAELEQAQAVSCLTPAELTRFAQFSYPKRKLEWLGGRMAAKFAAMSAATVQNIDAVPQWPTLEVAAAADGRPFIRAADNPDRMLPNISISHSHGLAAAMAAGHGRCGVDIQKVAPSVIRIQKKFAAPAEVDILHGLAGSGPEASQLTLLWAAKEALKKAIGTRTLPGFLEVKLSGAATDKDGEVGDYFVFDFNLPDSITSRAMHTFSVAALFYEKHVLAFTGVAEQCML
jgi:phosphopantetheinyl transferase